MTTRKGELMTELHVKLPGKVHTHLLELNSEHEYAAMNEALRGAERKRVGKGTSHEVTASLEVMIEIRDRCNELAGVERDAAAFGDGADSALRVALEKAAARVTDALPCPDWADRHPASERSLVP